MAKWNPVPVMWRAAWNSKPTTASLAVLEQLASQLAKAKADFDKFVNSLPTGVAP